VRLAREGDGEGAGALACSAAELLDVLDGALVPFERQAARPLTGAELARWQAALGAR
jgi:hypothetical protein